MFQKRWYGLPSSFLLQHLFSVCCLMGNSMVRQFDTKFVSANLPLQHVILFASNYVSVPCWPDSPDWGRVSVKALSTLSPALFEAAKKSPHLVSYEVCNWISFIISTVFVTSPQMYFLEYFKCIFLASWRSTREVPTSGRILKWEQIYAIIHTAGVISTTFRANIFSHSCDLRSEEASYVPQCVI